MKTFIIICLIIALYWLTSLVVLKNQVDRYAIYWNKLNSQNNENSKLYIALGDSAAQGIGASKPQYGYVGLISEKLNEGESYKTVNLSKSEARLSDVLDSQLPEMKKYKITNESVVTLGIGSNDMVDFDESKFRTQYVEILEKLPRQAIIADIPYFGAGIFRSREPSALAASRIIHELAEKSGHKVAKLHEYTRRNNNLTYFAVDYFHPNNKAYLNWYKAFDEHLPN